tara:strand:- start:379 stop:540 length:162 start_codon:yes stop_codon:yes gene_type:complete
MSKKYKNIVKEICMMYLTIAVLNVSVIGGAYLVMCNCVSEYGALGGYVGQIIG